MAWLLILVCLGSCEISFEEKTSTKLEYLVGIKVRALFATNAAIYALQKG